MKGFGMGMLALIALGQGCDWSSDSTWKCAGEAARFMPASVSVDGSKAMNALTDDERTAVCAEFSRALTANYAIPELACKDSWPGYVTGGETCQAAYDQCLQSPPPPAMIEYCTDKMSIWSCPITVGDYQACFNAFNAVRLAVALKPAPCAAADLAACGTVPPLPACASATPCDYIWLESRDASTNP